MRPYFILSLIFSFAFRTQAWGADIPLMNTGPVRLSGTIQRETGDTIQLSKEIQVSKDAVPTFGKDTSALAKPGNVSPMLVMPPDGGDNPPVPDPGGPPLPPVVEPDEPGDVSTGEAGRTAGFLDVSATGGATYSVPLTLPPGLGNAVPQLALTYNSQAGNGVAGYGWSISGLSTISRIPSTLFHDNNVGSINFDQKDRLALDGQRLILKSGTYGGYYATYQTEYYSNIKILSYGISPYGEAYGPAYFQVLYPDGSKAFYGASGDSRTPFEYAITYSESPLGARISYTYQQSNNVLQIKQIRFGSTSSTDGINQVNFSYTTAARSEQAWTAGQSFYRNQLLNKISIVAQGTPFRNYKLTYNTVSSTNYQRLANLQEFDGTETHSFPAIQFSYNSTSDIITSQVISNLSLSGIASNNAQVVTADFTGNGSMDFLVCPTSKDKFWAFYDIEPGSPNIQLGYQVNTGQFVDILPATWLSYNNKVLPGQGVILVKRNSDDTFKFEMLSAGTVAPVYYQYERSWNNPTHTPSFRSNCWGNIPGEKLDYLFFAGDFNGDGLTDVLAINKPKAYAYADLMDYPYPGECQVQYATVSSLAYLINMDRRVTSNYVTNLGALVNAYNDTDKYYTGDFNGDGKTDILAVQAGVLRVYAVVNNSLQVLWQTEATYASGYNLVLSGDYNGDGKTDILVGSGSYNNKFQTFISTGTSFVKFEGNQPFTNTQNSSSGGTLNLYSLIPNDVDGDGKTDIISAKTTTQNNSSTGTIVLTVYRNTAVASTSQPTFTTGASRTLSTNLKHYPIPIFLNPDRLNQKLEFGFISDNSISLFKFGKDQRSEAQLTSVWNDGISHSITYKPLLSGDSSDGTELYQPGYNQTFPYVDLSGAASMSVVSKITRYSTAPTVSQVFGYGEAVTHVQGLGFMGFGRLIRSNWNTGTGDANRLFSISIHDPQLRGANTKSFTGKSTYINPSILDVSLSSLPPASGIADGASLNDYVSRSDIAWHTELLPSKVFVNMPAATASKDMLTGTFATQSVEYDAWYNRTKVIGNFSGAGTKTEEYTYDNSTGDTYYIARLLTSQTTVNNGASAFSNREEYTYSGWLPTQVKKKGHNTDFITENLIYDSFGNITRQTLTVPGGAPRTVNMEYDATGRYLTKKTDPDGMATSFTYNTSTGTLASQTNPYGQTKTYSYDTWNRVLSNTDFVGAVTTGISYQKDANNNTVITESDSEGRSSISIVNPLGQTTETRVKDLSGQYIGKAFQYDAYGRKTGESEPAQPGSYNQWNYTEYDEYDRVKKQTSFTGQVTSIAYSGLSTTVNDGTKSVTTTSNALGHTVSVQDPGGTVNYTYFANGKLKTADYGGISQTVEQDGWGRKTKLTDPSAGQYQYEYDGFGQLTKETTPKGVTDYTYDAYGKITQKKLNGDNTGIQLDYTYDAVTKLLTGSTMTNADGNNAVYSYIYDQDKRLSSITEDNLHARFVTGYTYNSNNRIATESHEARNKLNNITVTKTIEMQYQNGELLQTTLQGTGQIVWKVNSIDNKGRISTVLQGGSLKTTFLYDSYGLPQQQMVERISGTPATLMTQGYSFDSQRGLLNSRSNSALSWSENFSYDNLNRLTDFNDNNGNHNQAYDNRGRITSSSLLGDYSYQGDSYRQSELTLNPAADALYQGIPLQQITYNAFKSPVSIYEQGHERISFQYNAALGRSHMYYGGEQEDKMQRRFRRHYSEDGAVEITNDIQAGTTSFIFYLGGDAYSAPAIWKEVYSGSQATQNLYYLHRDHLGSIVLITDEQGNPVEKRQFDAWGNIVRLTDGNGNNLTAFVILDRGYTGHEHLLGVGLIHMNGRLYDPRLHRFLSPDNYVQDPFSSQNFNRFGYAMNNPLTYVDESGEFLHLIIGALVGGVINWVAHGAHFNAKGLGYFASGAVAGSLGAGIGSGMSSVLGGGSFGAGFLGTSTAQAVGSGFMSGAVVGAAGGAAGGFALNFGNTLVDGGSFGSAFKSGLTGGAIGALSGGVLGGLAGGIDAALDGRDFWTGAGESEDYLSLYSNGSNSSQYSSTEEMRADYNSNIGTRDQMSLEQVERKIKTSVSLADNGNYDIDQNGLIVRDGGRTAGGITKSTYSGGFSNKVLSSKIAIAPGVKQFNLNIRNMVFKHEFMHAWHLNSGFANYNLYSERATSTFSYGYAKAMGENWMLKLYRPNLGYYPKQYSWTNFVKIVPLWVK